MTEEQEKKIKEYECKNNLNEEQITLIRSLVRMFGAEKVIDTMNKFTLTRFEIDLLEAEYNKKFTFYNIPLLIEMQRRGYYKGIPDNVPIEEILKNSICLE